METQIIHVRPIRTLADCKEYADKLRAGMGHHVRAELAALQMQQPACDLTFAPFLCGFENPYDDIYNIISHINNALIAGWGFFFEAERLRRELAELKGRPAEAVECIEIEGE
jgi:hypothetical protein